MVAFYDFVIIESYCYNLIKLIKRCKMIDKILSILNEKDCSG